jgi:hypothetical protein
MKNKLQKCFDSKFREYLSSCLLQLGKGMGGQKLLAESLGVSTAQVRNWETGMTPMKELHLLALEGLMSRMNKDGAKAAVDDTPTCPYCGQEIVLSEVNRGRFTISHRCRSGLTIKLHKRSREEALCALTKIVGVSDE